MLEGVPGLLAFRVVNQNTGTEVIHDLFHLHQARWEVRAIQKGTPGGSGLGQFEIPLPPPFSDQYKANIVDYNLLAAGQRIEAFLGGLVTGTPWQSGIILSIDKSFNSCVIRGIDALAWLQQSFVLPDEMHSSASPTADTILGQFSKTQEVQLDDTMATANLAANYTQTPAARWTTTTDSQTGAPAYTCSTTGSESYLIHNTNFAATSWISSRVDAIFDVTSGTDGTNAGEATVVVASDATGANCTFGRANFISTAGVTTVNGEIWSRAASANTLRASATTVFSPGGNAMRLQLTMTQYAQGSNAYWALYINGTFVARWLWTAAGATPSGRAGFRFNATAGGAPQVWAERLRFQARANTTRFATGTVSVGTTTGNGAAHLSGESDLDMVLVGASTEGWYIRKNAKYGYKADTIDLGASPGTDLSTKIRFEEGVNLSDLTIQANAENYALDLTLAATAGLTSGGLVTYPSPAAQNDLVLVGTAINPGITEFANLLQYANQIRVNAAAPGTAKTATVVRDPDTADKWRELDTVTLHAPSLGIFNQAVTILAYTLAEGEGSMAVTFDQFPATEANIPLGRVGSATRMLTTLYKTR